jgi:hypothetical protein
METRGNTNALTAQEYYRAPTIDSYQIVRRNTIRKIDDAVSYRSTGRFARLLMRNTCVAVNVVPTSVPSTLTILPTNSGTE